MITILCLFRIDHGRFTVRLICSQGIRRRLVSQTTECILVKLDMRFIDGTTLERWECELMGDDAINAGARFVELEGVEPGHLAEVTSGTNTLFVNGATIANGKLVVPYGAKMQFGTIEPRGPAAQKELQARENAESYSTNQGRMLLPLVNQKLVLAVRIVALDSVTTASVDTISDKVFGTFGDSVNLSERYRSCSFGEVIMTPFSGTTTTGRTIQNGVYQISIPTNIVGVTNTVVRDQVEAALTQELGNLPSQFDHVLLCIPPGTAGAWIAFSK